MVLLKYVKIIITGSSLKIFDVNVMSPPITLNPHRTISQSYKRLEFCLTKSSYYPKFAFNNDIVGKNLIIVLESIFDKFQNHPKMV